VASEVPDRAIKSALTAALSTARSAEKSRATVEGAATFDRRSTASGISPSMHSPRAMSASTTARKRVASVLVGKVEGAENIGRTHLGTAPATFQKAFGRSQTVACHSLQVVLLSPRTW